MINILALVPDEQAPSCRFRIRQFIRPLAGEGIALEVEGLGRDLQERRRSLRRAARFAAVILHRKLLRRVDFRRLRRHSRRLIYDFDDAVIFRDSNAPGFYSRARRLRFRRLAAGADLVLAGNEYLQEQARAAGAGRPVVFPTVVDTDAITPRPPAAKQKVIGWMGTSSNFVYLSTLVAPLRDLLSSRPDLVFRVIADRPPELNGLEVDFHRWKERDETEDLAGFSIGVMPLFDDPWTRGKCALKLLQYGAAGLPAVASPVGANLSVIRDGVNGYFAAGPEQWSSRIGQLLDSAEQRERMGRAARRLVEEKYSLSAAAVRLAEIIRRVIEPAPALPGPGTGYEDV